MEIPLFPVKTGLVFLMAIYVWEQESGPMTFQRMFRQWVMMNIGILLDTYKKEIAELEALKAERIDVVEEIRKAAATKDFSENAPLDAAREKQGQVETRIKILESTLEGAVLLEELKANGGNSSRIAIGSRVVLRHAQTKREVSYLLVEPQEADPSAGKLSVASPVGKAVLERTVGDEVEVATPGGAVQYVVAKVVGSSKRRR